ncbi:MAG TPA: DUF533 domain-containing protein [Vicinamibacterales bacterium]|nr:DUF533 domain-containing protein [Vicinamibacterales bacterium]
MNIEHMIGEMVLGSLGGRRKRSRRAKRFLTGGGGFLNASTLLALGGVAWGVFETLSRQNQGGQAQPVPGGFPPPGVSPAPPLFSAGPVTPPPLPGAAAAPAAPTAAPSGIPDGAVRIVRLMISAARADGTLSPDEREAILGQARGAGLEALAAGEVDHPTPLEAIVSGIPDEAQRRDLYTLAFSIVRADEQVSGAERIYLARLASLLGLDPAAAADLERKASAGIDAADAPETSVP